MAEVPELSDLLMNNSENDELFYDNDVPNKMKANKYSLSSGSRTTCLSKIRVEIKKSEKSVSSFKKVIALTKVVEKLKRSRGFHNQEFFFDDDLLSPVKLKEDIAFNRVENEEAVRRRFLYNQTSEHAIRDSNQKSLKLEGNDAIVVSSLAGENINLELKIVANTYLENVADNKRPVTLGIVDQNLYLCCTAEGIAKQLPYLMKVDDIKEKTADDELLPFIFYYRKDASVYTFESAAFPGYYLSTSQKDGDKLQLTPRSEVLVTEFRLTPRLE